MVLDIETLSTRTNAVITEIGAIAFDRFDFKEIDQIQLNPSIFPQIKDARHISPDTIDFHSHNKSLPATTGDISPEEALTSLVRFIGQHDPHHVWIQGPDFDRPILDSFLEAYLPSMESLWPFWRTRDARTIWDAAFPGVKHESRPHFALGDCRATLADLAAALKALNRPEAA